MYRFYNFVNKQTPSFWTTYFENPELLKVTSFINSVLMNKGTGYPLAQAYDILDIRDHVPGEIISWEKIKFSSYRYTKGHLFCHSYMLPSNILDIDTLHDSPMEPELDLQKGIDFVVPEGSGGIIRFKEDVPVVPLYISQGILDNVNLTIEDQIILIPELMESKQYTEYAYKYRVNPINSYTLTDLTQFIYKPRTSSEQIYEKDVDFVFDKESQILSTKTKLYTIPMWISKGAIISNRLDREYGQYLGYRRLDSTTYRDSLQVMNTYFMQGPTLPNVKAAVNQVFQLPVAKYGDETVVWANQNAIVTDKYRYNINGNSSKFLGGGFLKINEPLCDAIEFYTHKTHPNWWVDRAPEMFNKYSTEPLTASRKDRMMDTFLKHYVAQVRINTGKLSTYKLTFQQDLWDLVLDGLPVRSDLLLSMYNTIDDIGDGSTGSIPIPDYEQLKIGIRTETLWTGYSPKADKYLLWAASDRIKFEIGSEEVPTDWRIGEQGYVVLDPTSCFKQKWRKEKGTPSLLEPDFSQTFMYLKEDDGLPRRSCHFVSLNTPMVEYESHKAAPGIMDDVSTLLLERLNDECHVITLFSELVYDKQRFPTWDLNQLWATEDGLVPPLGTGGYAISTPFDLGRIPKNVKVSYTVDMPPDTRCTVYYTNNEGQDWFELTSGSTLLKMNGVIKFKVVLSATLFSHPIFKELDISLSIK